MAPSTRAWRCWLPSMPDLPAIVAAPSAGRARRLCALSCFDAGWIPRPSPHLIRCRRSPDHDLHPLLLNGPPGHCWDPAFLSRSYPDHS